MFRITIAGDQFFFKQIKKSIENHFIVYDFLIVVAKMQIDFFLGLDSRSKPFLNVLQSQSSIKEA